MAERTIASLKSKVNLDTSELSQVGAKAEEAGSALAAGMRTGERGLAGVQQAAIATEEQFASLQAAGAESMAGLEAGAAGAEAQLAGLRTAGAESMTGLEEASATADAQLAGVRESLATTEGQMAAMRGAGAEAMSGLEAGAATSEAELANLNVLAGDLSAELSAIGAQEAALTAGAAGATGAAGAAGAAGGAAGSAESNVIQDLAAIDGAQVKRIERTKELGKAEEEALGKTKALAGMTGELGAVGAETTEKMSKLGQMIGPGGGVSLGMAAGVIGLGALVIGMEAGKKEAEAHERAESLLAQAYKVTSQSLDQATPKLEQWLKTNEALIPNQNMAIEQIAAFTRAGFSQTQVIDAMNVTLNLAALKHIDVATAGHAVQMAMQGNAKAVKDLGIDMKELTKSDENAVQAHKDFDAATKLVETSTKNHDAAVKALSIKQQELAGKTKLTTSEQIALQGAHDKVSASSDVLKAAIDKQKESQVKLTDSQTTANQVLAALKEKTEGGTDAVSKSEQAQNRANAAWDRAANVFGPAVLTVETNLLTGATNLYNYLEAFGHNDAWWKGLNDGFVNVAHAADEAYGVISRLVNLVTGMGSPGSLGAAIGSILHGVTGLQHGGEALPNRIYTVGETAPETLVMGSRGGFVIPHAGGPSRAGAGGGGEVTYAPAHTFQITGGLSHEALATIRGMLDQDQRDFRMWFRMGLPGIA